MYFDTKVKPLTLHIFFSHRNTEKRYISQSPLANRWNDCDYFDVVIETEVLYAM